MAFAEARRQGFSPGAQVPSPTSSVNGSANEIKLKRMRLKVCQT